MLPTYSLRSVLYVVQPTWKNDSLRRYEMFSTSFVKFLYVTIIYKLFSTKCNLRRLTALYEV